MISRFPLLPLNHRWSLRAAAVALAAMALALPAAARKAPEFSLPTSDGKTVTLSQLRGKFVVIEFMSPT